MASYTSETESQNYYRLVSLMVDTGSSVLRKLLIKHVLARSASLEEHLNNSQGILDALHNRKHILSETQMGLLFPSNGTADVENFDITLLCCLLKNTCGKLPQQDKGEILDLQHLRNEVSGHMPVAAIDENNFKVFWGKITQVIITLAQFCGDVVFVQKVKDDIQELWIRPRLEPSARLTCLLQQWILSDKDLCQKMDKHRAEIQSEIARVGQDLETKMNTQSTNLQTEMKKQSTEVIEAICSRIVKCIQEKSDITEVQSEFSKTEQGLGEEMGKHRTEIKTEFSRIGQDIRRDVSKVGSKVRSLTEVSRRDQGTVEEVGKYCRESTSEPVNIRIDQDQENKDNHHVEVHSAVGSIDRKTDVRNITDMLLSKRNDGLSGLHTAAYHGHVDVLKCLVSCGADPRSKNVSGETILYAACQGGNIDMVKHIINSYPDMSSVKTTEEMSVLHTAAYHGHIKVLQYLLSCGVDPWCQNVRGETILYVAC